jgi:hypothetical protein
MRGTGLSNRSLSAVSANLVCVAETAQWDLAGLTRLETGQKQEYVVPPPIQLLREI